jgi:hypothetical protein
MTGNRQRQVNFIVIFLGFPFGVTKEAVGIHAFIF